jgi:hypothetical protein
VYYTVEYGIKKYLLGIIFYNEPCYIVLIYFCINLYNLFKLNVIDVFIFKPLFKLYNIIVYSIIKNNYKRTLMKKVLDLIVYPIWNFKYLLKTIFSLNQ